jgi:hypothetical protein
LLTFSFLDESDPDFALKREIKPISAEERGVRCEEIERRINSRCKGLLESRPRQQASFYPDHQDPVHERDSYTVDFLHRTVRDFLRTPTVHARLVAHDTADFDANLALARALVAHIKGLQHVSDAGTNHENLWFQVLHVLYHVRHVANEPSPQTIVDLLDEMDRAAAHFRALAISTAVGGCDSTVHWVNTGHNFYIKPEWNNDFITMCVGENVLRYVSQKLVAGTPLTRSGKPLLAFAITPYRCSSTRPVGIYYTSPKVKMARFLLGRGANPNDMDGNQSVWVRCLISMYGMYTIEKPLFSGHAKDWFEITRLLLLHGADPRVIIESEIFAEQKNSPKGNPSPMGPYTAMDIIHELFGRDSRFDVAELEDLIEQPAEGASRQHNTRDPSQASPQGAREGSP